MEIRGQNILELVINSEMIEARAALAPPRLLALYPVKLAKHKTAIVAGKGVIPAFRKREIDCLNHWQ
jgi:hypothetical protein